MNLILWQMKNRIEFEWVIEQEDVIMTSSPCFIIIVSVHNGTMQIKSQPEKRFEVWIVFSKQFACKKCI